VVRRRARTFALPQGFGGSSSYGHARNWRYQHVQAIIVAIDQYAEAATGNRDFFLNRPPGASRADMP
jgi:hypothetical protein